MYRKTLYRCFALVWLVTLAGCATDHWRANRVTDGLVLYYSFAADDDSVAHDQSGNGHDGKIINAKRVTDGIAGSALSFDGQSAYVRVTNAKQLQSTNFSFSVWAQSREKIGVRMRVGYAIEHGAVWRVRNCARLAEVEVALPPARAPLAWRPGLRGYLREVLPVPRLLVGDP